MKNFSKICMLVLMVVIMPCVLIFAGCNEGRITIVSVDKTGTQDLVDTYTITYSDGSTSTFTVTNGRDGTSGRDGADGADVNIQDIYQSWLDDGHTGTYSDFLREYLTLTVDDTKVVNENLLSVLKIYTEFKVTSYDFWTQRAVYSKSISGGSGVIYRMDNDYTYVVTNYHVVFNASSNEDNGGKFSSKIMGYMYGSQYDTLVDKLPYKTEQTEGEHEYPVYDYGDFALEFSYVGGSLDKDIAVIKIPTATILARNPQAKAVTLADSYIVGSTAIAIGNPEGLGISVTKGIVSVDSEYIALQIDTTQSAKAYRSIRMDTAIYGGSSGGGLFDESGKLIGITNAGNGNDENVNYAVPLPIVRNTADAILRYYLDDDTTTNGLYRLLVGFNVEVKNSKYVYNVSDGTGQIVETIEITSVTEDSLASSIGMQIGDVIQEIIINNVHYSINRNYEITDWLTYVKAGDTITFKVLRNNETITYTTHTIVFSDLISVE